MNIETLGKLIAFYVAGQSTVPASVYKENKENIYSTYIREVKRLSESENIELDEKAMGVQIESYYSDLLADTAIVFPQLLRCIYSENKEDKKHLLTLANTFTDEAPIKNEFLPFNELLISELKGA